MNFESDPGGFAIRRIVSRSQGRGFCMIEKESEVCACEVLKGTKVAIVGIGFSLLISLIFYGCRKFVYTNEAYFIFIY